MSDTNDRMAVWRPCHSGARLPLPRSFAGEGRVRVLYLARENDRQAIGETRAVTIISRTQ